jgi:hypothetical protein
MCGKAKYKSLVSLDTSDRVDNKLAWGSFYGMEGVRDNAGSIPGLLLVKKSRFSYVEPNSRCRPSTQTKTFLFVSC